MLWFKKKQPPVDTSVVYPVVEPSIEITIHKDATKKEVKVLKDAAEKVNKAFERNHFTVKLYVAAGHTAPKAK